LDILNPRSFLHKINKLTSKEKKIKTLAIWYLRHRHSDRCKGFQLNTYKLNQFQCLFPNIQGKIIVLVRLHVTYGYLEILAAIPKSPTQNLFLWDKCVLLQVALRYNKHQHNYHYFQSLIFTLKSSLLSYSY